MKSDRKKIIGLAVLALPFLAMLLMIGMNMRNLSHGEYRMAIEGYDPRDLLRGHYLTFRYKWDAPSDYKHALGCACISGEALNPVVRVGKCPSSQNALPEACQSFIRVERRGGYQPYEESRRVYIPDIEAPLLEKMLREGQHRFEVGVVPQSDGRARVKTLYIDGKPLDEFLKSMPAP